MMTRFETPKVHQGTEKIESLQNFEYVGQILKSNFKDSSGEFHFSRFIYT